MLATIASPFADTRAADLSWSLGVSKGRDLHDALAVLDVAAADVRLQLRVLGASHQVLLRGPGGRCSEVVACLPGRQRGLPAIAERDLPGGSYSFRSRTARLTEVELAVRVGRLRAVLATDPYALVGEFPGSVSAVTVLRAFPAADAVGWTTWHAYPQTGELVRTESRLVIR